MSSIKKIILVILFAKLTLAQILVMVNQEQTKKEFSKSTIIKDQNETVISTRNDIIVNDENISNLNDSFNRSEKTISSINDNNTNDQNLSSSSKSVIDDFSNQTTTKISLQVACPPYSEKHNNTEEILNFMRITYDAAVDLCNSSSRVGCKYSNFLRQISSCVNSKYFNLDDIRAELSENKNLLELPRQTSEEPVLGYVSFKVLNIDAISVKDMDFKMDFYLGISWDIRGEFFRRYMTRLCVSKKVDLEKKKSLLLYQDDLKLFWLPDIYFPNSKPNSKTEQKTHLKRPISRDYLEVSFKKDKENNPFLRFVFVTSGHSNLLCPMKFDDYPSDVQHCVVKIRSFYYYLDELKLIWYVLAIDNLKALEYSIAVSKGEDLEEDHFVVVAGSLNKNFTRLLIHFNFTRQLTSKLSGIYLPSLMLNSLNYLTYYFGVNSYPARSSIGIMVLLTLTIMFSKVRSELPGASSISGMEIWLISCFIYDLIQLLEASIVESIYTNHCIEYYLKKKSKRELETEFLGYSYSMLFNESSDDEEEEDHFDDQFNQNSGLFSKSITYLGALISNLILPSVSRKKPEYWSIFLDKVFRILIPISLGIFLFWHLKYLKILKN